MIHGRYYTRNNRLVAVHGGMGHTILQNGMIDMMQLCWDKEGNCINPIQEKEQWDLMERVNPQGMEDNIVVGECESCKNA